VSVLVSQEDALKIILAKELGELSLSLRGPADNAPTIARSIDDKKILGTPTEQTPIGVAKGPDGQLYSLANNHSRPVRVESTPIME
jgi:Flp pilus assembly protein CpaB